MSDFSAAELWYVTGDANGTRLDCRRGPFPVIPYSVFDFKTRILSGNKIYWRDEGIGKVRASHSQKKNNPETTKYGQPTPCRSLNLNSREEIETRSLRIHPSQLQQQQPRNVFKLSDKDNGGALRIQVTYPS